MVNIMKCTLCNSSNIVIKSERIDDFFDGDLFIYDEAYTECRECGFEFVSAEQSTLNLKSRFAGKVSVQETVKYISSHKVYSYQEFNISFSPIYGLESLDTDIKGSFFIGETRKISESLREIPVMTDVYNPCYMLT